LVCWPPNGLGINWQNLRTRATAIRILGGVYTKILPLWLKDLLYCDGITEWAALEIIKGVEVSQMAQLGPHLWRGCTNMCYPTRLTSISTSISTLNFNLLRYKPGSSLAFFPLWMKKIKCVVLIVKFKKSTISNRQAFKQNGRWWIKDCVLSFTVTTKVA
jgi:hypothetical protein